MDVMCEGVILREALRTCALHNLPEGALQNMFLSHGGVMCQSKQIADIGHFVQISSTEVSSRTVLFCLLFFKYYRSLLVICGRLQGCNRGGTDICVVKKLQQQLNTDGTPFLTEFECPVLVQTEDLYVCDASTIYSPVSIVHICSSTCTISSDSMFFSHNLYFV